MFPCFSWKTGRRITKWDKVCLILPAPLYNVIYAVVNLATLQNKPLSGVHCEQSLSKTHQRATKKSSAEIVSSPLSRHSPSFWASHSGQTGLSSPRIIFLTRRRSKSSLQYEKWRLGVRSRLDQCFYLSPSNGLRILNKDLTRFLQSPFFLVELREALLAGCVRGYTKMKT